MVDAAFAQAQWSFDGPRQEWIDADASILRNRDTPGLAATMDSHFPLIIHTEFIGVLFNQNTGQILNVTPYTDRMEIWANPG